MPKNDKFLAQNRSHLGQNGKNATNQLDKTDSKLLALLQQNARLTNLELADAVGLSPSPCLRRLKRLERDGIISRYVALVDQKAVGLPVSVFVSVKLERQREDAMAHFDAEIATYPVVLECYLMTGSWDYLLRVVAADLGAYEKFLKDRLTRIDGVSSIESYFALNQLKYNNKLPIEV
jgi:Lrp/AsnC family leucine-responsive transcriptional regulator